MSAGDVSDGIAAAQEPWATATTGDRHHGSGGRMTTISTATKHLGRPGVPLLAATTVLLAACNQVGTANFTFWDAMYTLAALFLWLAFIWIFIKVFADIFRRNDLTGVAKASWLLLVVVLPFIGCLIYIAARPKVTAHDVETLTRLDAGEKAAASVSVADQVAKLQELRAAGAISEAEFEALKQQAIAGGS
jgi:predicted membrane channel-forming protein YqfA (hemolysin III family)